MRPIKIGSHSWACIGGGEDVLHSYGSNQGYVIGEEACLVVDTGFHNRTAREVMRGSYDSRQNEYWCSTPAITLITYSETVFSPKEEGL